MNRIDEPVRLTRHDLEEVNGGEGTGIDPNGKDGGPFIDPNG